MRDVAGGPAQIEGVLVVFEGERVHRIAPIAVQVSLLGRRNDECVQPGFGEERAHWVKPWPAVGAYRAEEGKADPVVVKQVSSLAGQFGLLGFKVAPRDHVERAWHFQDGLSTAIVHTQAGFSSCSKGA